MGAAHKAGQPAAQECRYKDAKAWSRWLNEKKKKKRIKNRMGRTDDICDPQLILLKQHPSLSLDLSNQTKKDGRLLTPFKQMQDN